jgi:hypothetical protein
MFSGQAVYVLEPLQLAFREAMEVFSEETSRIRNPILRWLFIVSVGAFFGLLALVSAFIWGV